MKQDIASLVALQMIDRQIRKLDQEIAAGHKDLQKRQEGIAERRVTMAELQERIDAAEKRRRELEAEMETELTKIKDRQTKLMNVQTNREYQSLLKEIEDGKKNNKQREDETVGLMERIEAMQVKLTEQANLCASEEKLLGEVQATADQTEAQLGAKKNDLFKVRAQNAEAVTAPLLRKYELLRERRNGTALAAVQEGVCRGCNMNIPPQLFIELQKGEQLLACPTCNRLMYHEAEKEEV